MNITKPVIYVFSIVLLISCGTDVVENDEKYKVNKDDSPVKTEVFKYMKFTDLEDYYQKGLDCVLNNDTTLYDDIILKYRLSPFPTRGIWLAELMSIKNDYPKSYYDIVKLYDFKGMKYYSSFTEKRLLSLLNKAKEGGYEWGGSVTVFDNEITFDDPLLLKTIVAQ